MNITESIMRHHGITSGYRLEDRVRAGDVPKVTTPRPEHKELPNKTRLDLIALTRFYTRNDGVLAEIAENIALYSVGDGIAAQPMSSDADWNERAFELWEQWCEYPEITGKFSMFDIQNLICHAMETDGEFFMIRLLKDGKPYLQCLESQYIAGEIGSVENTASGIITDAYGRPEFYVFRDGDRTKKIPAHAVLHIANFRRLTSVRGTPTLQRSVPDVHDVEELIHCEKRKARAQSNYALFVSKQDHEEGDMGEEIAAALSDTETEAQTQVADSKTADALGGVIVRGAPGEDMKTITTDSPPENFQNFLVALTRRACLGSGIPYEFAIKPGDIGGASVRLVTNRAGRLFSRRQSLLIRRFLRPVYQWFIACQIKAGRLQDAVGWEKVEWQVPRDVSVDAGRDSGNIREDIRLGIASMEDAWAASGGNARRELRARARFIAEMTKVAAEYGIPLAALSNIFETKSGQPISTQEQPEQTTER